MSVLSKEEKRIAFVRFQMRNDPIGAQEVAFFNGIGEESLSKNELRTL